jgi:hypothetical protein
MKLCMRSRSFHNETVTRTSNLHVMPPKFPTVETTNIVEVLFVTPAFFSSHITEGICLPFGTFYS